MLFVATLLFFFFFNDTATTEIYTLSLHDALPISRSFPVQACKHPPAASLFSPAFRALGSKPGTKVTARSSLFMGWFPCAAAVLGSPNAQGKPAQHIHLPLGGRTARGKARSGRCFPGTNGATLWLWSCLPKPGAPGP